MHCNPHETPDRTIAIRDEYSTAAETVCLHGANIEAPTEVSSVESPLHEQRIEWTISGG